MPNPSKDDTDVTAQLLGVPLSTTLAEGEPSSGHPDSERELVPGIVVVSRVLAVGVLMVRVKGDLAGLAGYGVTWKEAVIDLLQAHRDWETAEGLAS
jgi:hypothetical protein